MRWPIGRHDQSRARKQAGGWLICHDVWSARYGSLNYGRGSDGRLTTSGFLMSNPELATGKRAQRFPLPVAARVRVVPAVWSGGSSSSAPGISPVSLRRYFHNCGRMVASSSLRLFILSGFPG